VENEGDKGTRGQGRLLSPIPNNLNILYISSWKNCPLQLKIKMRAVDKTLIST
jgi:hypothetical protein